MMALQRRPRPKITRAAARRLLLSDRAFVAWSAHLQGCSIRLIAAGLGTDEATVCRMIEEVDARAENIAPEDSPKSLPAEPFEEST